jgi:hypothetical protein
MNVHASLLLSLCLCALGGCVSTPAADSRSDGSRSDGSRSDYIVSQASVPDTFDYTRADIAFSNHDLPERDERRYEVKHISFPSVGDNGQYGNLVTARYYKSKSPGIKKLLIVLPIWGSYTYPPDVISKGIRSRTRGDTNVLMIQGEDFLINWYDIGAATSEEDFREQIIRMGDRLQTAVIDTRRIIDWAQAREEIDPDGIGLIGFSLGALVGGLVTASEDRLAATVLVMGAADFPGVMATCEGRPGEARENVVGRLGWSVEQYRQHVAAEISHLDPSHYSQRIDPDRIFVIDAHHDDCMPQSSRDALWRAMGHPRRMSFLAGHKTSFLFMTPLAANYMRGEIYQFFDEKL